MNYVRIISAPRRLDAEVILPASKSISNRALIIRALSGVDFPILNLSLADDTLLLDHFLQEKSDELYLDTGNAGTVMRFLTAYYACLPGKDVVLTGGERMQERPVAPLVEALRQLGAQVSCREKEGFPPLHIEGRRLKGGSLTIDASMSSQFVSALLLIAPALESPLQLKLVGVAASAPYIDLTLRVLADFGIRYEKTRNSVTIAPQPFQPHEYWVENDWSAASYWYGLAAVIPGSDVKLPGLLEKSPQGDIAITAIAAEYFGVATSWEGIRLRSEAQFPPPEKNLSLDMHGHPDLIPTLVTLCCLRRIPFRIEGTATLRHKESDRAAALQTELAKLGFSIQKEENALSCVAYGGEPVNSSGLVLNTYHDHRLAMCWAMAAAGNADIRIENPACVVKSYPDFWLDLEKAGFKLEYKNIN